jgi:hypothetical protein
LSHLIVAKGTSMAITRKFLDLAVTHLWPDDQIFLHEASLRQTGKEIVRCAEMATGWFMYADEAAQINLPDVPHRICIIMIHARQKGCDYVLFDTEGPEDPDLPVFEPG